MRETITKEGFNFEVIKSTNPRRPYRVRCLESLEEKDSALSYDDAVCLLLTPMLAAKKQIEITSHDIEYVKKAFSILLGKKKSQCDELVKNEIVNRGLIKGTIYSLKEKERFQEFKEYQTDVFIVTAYFEKGLIRGCTKIGIDRL